MSSKENGGVAFPVADYDHMIFQPETIAETKRDLSGMSLRDYFAAKALQGQMDREKYFGKTVREQGFAKYAAHIAQTSYQLADAMLAERAK